MSEADANIPIDAPADIARGWRRASVAIAALIAAVVITHRVDFNDPGNTVSLLLLAFELLPVLIVASLVRSAARKGIVLAMLLGMFYVAHATIIATGPDSRSLGGLEFILSLGLFGALFVVGRALLAEERRLNP